MVGAPESRGWEINTQWNQHPLDDADWEIDPESGGGKFMVVWIVVYFALTVGLLALQWSLAPPVVRLSPVVPIAGHDEVTWRSCAGPGRCVETHAVCNVVATKSMLCGDEECKR